MKNIEPLLNKISGNYAELLGRIKELKKLQSSLQKKGIDYGTPHYKDGRYMRIVKPATNTQGRQYVYVGSDTEKQDIALAALERGRQFDEADKEISALQREINAMYLHVAEIA